MRFSLLCGSSFPNRSQSSRQLTIARNSNRKFILWSLFVPEVPKSPNTIFYSTFLHFLRNDAKFLSLSFKQCFFCMHVYPDNFFHKISVKRIHTTNKTIYFSLKISPVTCFSLKHLHSLEISRFTRHCVFCPVSAT